MVRPLPEISTHMGTAGENAGIRAGREYREGGLYAVPVDLQRFRGEGLSDVAVDRVWEACKRLDSRFVIVID